MGTFRYVLAAHGLHGAPHRDVVRLDEVPDNKPDGQPGYDALPARWPNLQGGHEGMASALLLTRHAFRRQRQRSIPALALELLIAFGRASRSHGATRLEFDRRARRDVAVHLGGCRVPDLEHKVFGTYAIVADDGAIITVGYRQGSSRPGRARLHMKESSARNGFDSKWFAKPRDWRSSPNSSRSRLSSRCLDAAA